MLDCISVIIIEEEIYGITPKAKIPILPRAPPEKVSNIPRIPDDCCSKNCCKAIGFMPGIGKKVPSRKTISAPNVKNNLCLNSIALPKAPKQCFARSKKEREQYWERTDISKHLNKIQSIF